MSNLRQHQSQAEAGGNITSLLTKLGGGIECGADICNTHEEPHCVLHHQTFKCDHHCDEHHLCDNEVPDPHGDIPDCCCKDQACVDFVKSTTNTHLEGVKCPDCPDVQKNQCHGDLHHRCAPDEMCEVITNGNGIASTRCQHEPDCIREQHLGTLTDPRSKFCCRTQTCINSVFQNPMGTTTTMTASSTTNKFISTTVPPSTAKPLYCPVCSDAFTGNCTQSACASNEGCMLTVTHGQLRTGCEEITNCQYHERIGDAVCCTDKNCTDIAFQKMLSSSFTCPICINAQDPHACMRMQGKCSYLSKGCMITHSQGGISSGCNAHSKHCEIAQAANSPLCNVNPIPFTYSPGLQCSFCCHNNDSTCILNAFGVHDVTPSPTTGISGKSFSSCVDHEDSTFSCKDFDKTYNMCSSAVPFMVHLVGTKCQKTCGRCPGSGPLLQCEDKVSACPVMASSLCSLTDPASQQYANENCAKTCNLCAATAMTTPVPCVDKDNNCAGMAGFLCPSTDSQSLDYAKEHCAKTCNHCATSSPLPTVSAQCIDHDLYNNCATLGNQLCNSQEIHVKNFAIASCAKTCNLCTEYFLSGPITG
ncbi:uncharacterized protein LOC132550113 [Ylistrum balloti]|uniref:uncharacterized protein LOC132550113 n=1 Tax=Ylistrum balloti TaxID=509963 RepID=UPI002905D581|nr:uncharacterized protein LOC132550113 [Ylistrum balloti]